MVHCIQPHKPEKPGSISIAFFRQKGKKIEQRNRNAPLQTFADGADERVQPQQRDNCWGCGIG